MHPVKTWSLSFIPGVVMLAVAVVLLGLSACGRGEQPPPLNAATAVPGKPSHRVSLIPAWKPWWWI